MLDVAGERRLQVAALVAVVATGAAG
jgi:hypothetical protein